MSDNVLLELARFRAELRNAQIWIDRANITSFDLEQYLTDPRIEKYSMDTINPKDYDLRNYLTGTVS